ncbi:methyltransferase domain-containing protein [Candidatus Mycobacterium methanotrophicum]|uniref:methyltransferase domain-containing protein n=1 Tax=Candidatus Mycobacterium methanotrophicum TaxID=2943498 RepID=UPI001C580F44
MPTTAVYCSRLLLGQLPEHSRRVLDAACGAGAFAARLARRVEHVDAVDRSAAMIELARQRTLDNVNGIWSTRRHRVTPSRSAPYTPRRSCCGSGTPPARCSVRDPARSTGSNDWFAKDRAHAAMPVVLAQLTTREVTRQAGKVIRHSRPSGMATNFDGFG